MMETPVRTILIGQPNVGKSALFTRMTGVGVISSNYAGTTVEFEESVVSRNGSLIEVRDLPGTYSLSKNSPDEEVVIQILRQEQYDSVVVVADSTNLSSSLVLCFEVLELGLPTILALNKYDVATKKLDINVDVLSEMLGIPVIPVSAKNAYGVDTLMDSIASGAAKVSGFKVNYSKVIEKSIDTISAAMPSDRFSSYGASVKALEGCHDFSPSDDLQDSIDKIRSVLTDMNSEAPEITIGRERFALSDSISRQVLSKTQRAITRKEKFEDMTVEPLTGIPILFAVFGVMFLTIVYAGQFLDAVVSSAYDWVIGDALTAWAEDMDSFPQAVVNGINGSISAILCLVIPYIMVFYIMLGILEDSGYLPRIVVLLDSLMHRFGLHGGAAIPLMVGIGCNVPAIMATRTIRSRRERLIIASLIIMVVPCSAQISIIMGITGKYAGIQWAFAIMAMLVALGCLIGIALNKYLPKSPSNLAMELPDLVFPHAKNVFYKTWERIKDFFVIAFPLLVVGSIIIEVLLTYNALDPIVEPFSFITVTMLGLPAVCIICFIVGILRKEMAVGMLVILLGENFFEIMTPEQFVVFGIVMATYVPCLASLTVLWKEMGPRDTIHIVGTSCLVALMLGTLAHFMFTLF
ncbi:MAG: ferrous iron transport protein B [archaeon]|nr:ferrous iron transport protein B [archaeon]